jgi:hypothetical protein
VTLDFPEGVIRRVTFNVRWFPNTIS